MTLETSIQNLADAINNLASTLAANPPLPQNLEATPTSAAVATKRRGRPPKARPAADVAGLPFPTDLLAARLARAGRHEAEAFHFRGPFFVMVAGSGRFPEGKLPMVRHLVPEGLQNLHVRLLPEHGGIQGQFRHAIFSAALLEAARGIIAARSGLALIGDKQVRQFAPEKLVIEHGVGVLDARVFLARVFRFRRHGFPFCFVRNNL